MLCRESLRTNQCFDPSCTLAHIKGTVCNQGRIPIKKPSNQSSGSGYSNNQHHTKGNTKYSTYDSSKLGFHDYRQTLNDKRGYAYAGGHSQNQASYNQNNYSYSSNDFPNLNANQDSRHP